MLVCIRDRSPVPVVVVAEGVGRGVETCHAWPESADPAPVRSCIWQDPPNLGLRLLRDDGQEVIVRVVVAPSGNTANLSHPMRFASPGRMCSLVRVGALGCRHQDRLVFAPEPCVPH